MSAKGSLAFDYLLEADRPNAVTQLHLRERPPGAAEPQEVTDQEHKTKIEAREAASFWRACLSDEIGRREIYKALNLAEAFSMPFAASPAGFPDKRATWHRAGQISIGQRFYQMLAIVARDELFKLQDEMNIYGALAVRPDRQV